MTVPSSIFPSAATFYCWIMTRAVLAILLSVAFFGTTNAAFCKVYQP
jgi:hypothetical protein